MPQLFVHLILIVRRRTRKGRSLIIAVWIIANISVHIRETFLAHIGVAPLPRGSLFNHVAERSARRVRSRSGAT